ncbi:hypothetical protein E7T06_16355 [Deinococcus sp. Arct2-2]|uniref:hypothetical protein n=1 Tax=Deinococcus sp. Arct2-2 TaxID=2568653 RepID=UPI0010A45DA9|nr:hypothetical protein [Deinococcus sp. Arct2-2]THF68500.1 hypothetical protein E7T06_16355 [Deinococcus sp. Arct2-2]
MLRAGLWTLTALVLFALIFAFLPSGNQAGAGTGAKLSGVALSLYPARDEGAVWRFRAANVSSDPVAGETRLSGLSDGKRLLREKNKAGIYTGRETLDATLTAPSLTIDSQDNMTTQKARITLVAECADIDLTGNAQPVKIEQGYGFTAPLAVIDSPDVTGRVAKIRMSFQFVVEDSDNDNSTYSASLDPTETCRDGKRVPL